MGSNILYDLIHGKQVDVPKPEPVTPRNTPNPEGEVVDPKELMDYLSSDDLNKTDSIDIGESHEVDDTEESDEVHTPEGDLEDHLIDYYDFTLADKFKYMDEGSDMFRLVDTEGNIYNLSTRMNDNVYTWFKCDPRIPTKQNIRMTLEEDENSDDVYVFRIIDEKVIDNADTGAKEGTSVARSTNG